MVETTADKQLEAAAASRQKEKFEYITRFNVSQRVEHIILMVTFIALAVTGLAEKFYASGWAEWLINSMGG
jgi:cytochrome b subunit of formate dehydrogenase